jgi:hypothetical protein
MQEWYLMTPNTRPNLTGGFENDTYLNYKDDAFAETLETDIATTVTLYNSDLSESIFARCIIQNNVSNSQKSSVERQGLFQLDVLKDISYVYFDNKYWLITNYIGNNGLYEKAILQLCNYLLKFQSPNGTILSYYCIDKSSISIGLDENKDITTVDGIHYLSLPFDENTKLINIDKRFFIDKYGTTTCKVSHVNNTEFDYGDKGLIVLTTKEDAYNPKTDINGICNYFSPTTPPQDESGILSYSKLKCSSTSNQISVGSYRYITATMYDSKDVINTIITPVFTYEFPTGFEDQFTVSVIDRNKIKLSVKDNNALLSKSVKVGVSDGQGGFVSEITLTIIAGI